VSAQGDDDGDEVLPRKLAETKRLAGQRVVTLAFGGQVQIGPTAT